MGLPFREIGEKRGGGQYAFGEIGAFVGNVIPTVPLRDVNGKIPFSQIEHYSQSYLQDVLPSSLRVIVAVGDIACKALCSGSLPMKWRSILHHCSSIIPPSLNNGMIDHNAFVIPIRHTAALLRGSDEYYPSVRMGLKRALNVWRGGYKSVSPPSFVLRANTSHIPEAFSHFVEKGYFSVDLETPYGEMPTSTILCGAFCSDEKGWVFDAAQCVELYQKCINHGIRIVAHNGAAFDIPVLSRNGATFSHLQTSKIHDTIWIDGLLRPRMPHMLHQVASHMLEEGPPSWKHLGSTQDPIELREYCALDAWYTARIYLSQMSMIKREGLEESYEVREGFTPVITRCAIEGIRVDVHERDKLRRNAASIYSTATGAFQKDISAWATRQRVAFESQLKSVEENKCKVVSSIRGADASLKKALKEERKELQKEIVLLRTKVKQYENPRPAQRHLMQQYLYFDPDGLCLPVQKHKDTKKPTTGRRAVARLAKSKKGREHGVLRTMPVADRLRSVMGLHLGLRLNKKTHIPDMDIDHQRIGDRIQISYHPVRMRMAAGKGGSIDPELQAANQMQKAPHKIVEVGISP